jgi:HK97 family phage major capsid protein
MSIQALREKRGTIAAALKELVTKPEYDAATDDATYNAQLADLDKIDAQIARINDVNAKLADDTRDHDVAEVAARRGRDTQNKGLKIFAKWLKGGDKALSAEDWADVRNTMSTTTGSEGGFTVASEVAATVIEALKAFGGMRGVADVITTSTGGQLAYPTSDGTAEEGEIVLENQSATDLDVSFGTVALPVFKFSSKVITIPMELLQDSAIDVEGFVQRRMVTRLGRITNRLFTTGTGSGQPNGAQVAAAIGVTAANSTSQVTTITYDSLVDLQHSVDPAYREMGNCRFMFNDTTARQLRKIKDGSGRPIFVAGYESGNPADLVDRIMSAPYTINQAMPDMAASAKSILWGDFMGYTVRDVMNIEMFRFTDSAYTKKGQVGFLGWLRTGGNLTDAGAIRAFRNAAS